MNRTKENYSKPAVSKDISRYLLPDEVATAKVELRTYPNGLRVLSERVSGASSLALGLWVNAGSQNESNRTSGIAHFIEHVVFKGTAGRSMRQIMRSIESRGGYLNAFTTKEHTCFYTWTRTTHLEESVSVLFDLATRPVFSKKDIENEKAVIVEEINGLEDEPDELVFELFEREVFGNHPLGRPIAGNAQSVGRFDRDKLLSFHNKHYRASDMVMVASGSHQHDALFRAIDKAIRHVPPHVSRRAPAVSKFPRRTEAERHFPRAAGQQSHIILGRRVPGIQSPRHLAINAVITIAGAGMSSRLNLRLREELGLAYDAMSFYAPFERVGTLGLYIATATDPPNRVQRAVREMRRIASGLITKPISKAELEHAKEQMIGGLVLPMESVTNRMMRAAQNMLYFNQYQPIERDVEKIVGLRLEDVRREAERLFGSPREMILVSVMPASEENHT